MGHRPINGLSSTSPPLLTPIVMLQVALNMATEDIKYKITEKINHKSDFPLLEPRFRITCNKMRRKIGVGALLHERLETYQYQFLSF